MEKIFEKIPFFGFYSPNFQKFVDKDLYDAQSQSYIRLTKVKIWYGTAREDYKENISGKFILGIQSFYINTLNGEKKETKINCGDLVSNDIIIKELELIEGDYITKLYMCYNDIISYLKFITRKDKILEIGNYDKNLEKTIPFNLDPSPHMIHSFHGYFNKCGLRALGCVHLKRRKFFFFNHIEIFRVRHILKTKPEEKSKWVEEKIMQLNYYERAFIRVCLLPDSQFSSVIMFCY